MSDTTIPSANKTLQRKIPITLISGFLGSGKSTIILKVLKSLQSSDETYENSLTKDDQPSQFKAIWLKNEYGLNEVDSVLAAQSAISDVKEIINGCLCCTLVGRLTDSLREIVASPSMSSTNRIIIETSGSAYPAALVQEINRCQQELGLYLDGVITVVDALNYEEYSDNSYSSRIQAQYTDLILLNKHELVSESQVNRVKDLLLDICPEVPIIRTDRGFVSPSILFGIDTGLIEKGVATMDLEVSSDQDVEVVHVEYDQVVSVQQFHTFMKQLHLRNCIRCKGVIVVAVSQDQASEIASYDDVSKAFTSTTATTLDAESSPVYHLVAVVNWILGRWSLTPISLIPIDHSATPPRPCQDYPSLVLTPSILYQPYPHDSFPDGYASPPVFTRLTVFGHGINTFSFLKFVATSLPVTRRSSCCEQQDAMAPGGFVVALTKGHSHSHGNSQQHHH